MHIDSSRRAAVGTTDVEAGVVERAETEVICASELSRSGEEGGTCEWCSTGRLSSRRVEVDQADGQAVEVLWLSEVGSPCKKVRVNFASSPGRGVGRAHSRSVSTPT